MIHETYPYVTAAIVMFGLIIITIILSVTFYKYKTIGLVNKVPQRVRSDSTYESYESKLKKIPRKI